MLCGIKVTATGEKSLLTLRNVCDATQRCVDLIVEIVSCSTP